MICKRIRYNKINGDYKEYAALSFNFPFQRFSNWTDSIRIQMAQFCFDFVVVIQFNLPDEVEFPFSRPLLNKMNRYLRKTLSIGGQLAKYFCVAHCTFTYVGNLVLVRNCTVSSLKII